MTPPSPKSLQGLRVLDLSRVLAGPVCTQILGDLGADIIKIEKPDSPDDAGSAGGDDTRRWGPPFLQTPDGQDSRESAYYLSANRNKRSVTIDITKPAGQELVHGLLTQSDVMIQNFKRGGLDKYGLDYNSLAARYPALIYCHITGFGQSGPLAKEPGYDFLAQAMGGLMAVTGEPDGAPMKTGVALSDVMTGLYSAIGILAALRHRDQTGEGQMVDLSLLDCTVAGMTNIAQYYLTSGQLAPRLGNAHSTIVPYQAFATKNGHIILAIGNDRQFRRFCDYIGQSGWADDSRFATNDARVRNRDELVPQIAAVMTERDTDQWIAQLHKIGIPAGPVNDMAQVFDMEQISARGMKITMDHPHSAENIALVGSPLKLSRTPPSYDRPPPCLGQHSAAVLSELLGLSEADIQALRNEGVI